MQISHAALLTLAGMAFGAENMVRNAEGNEEIQSLGRLISQSERIVALTGAGISTESGIPDFRSPGGLWTRGIKPITYQDFVSSEEARLEDWRRRFRMNDTFAAARPNAGHLALVQLMREGRLHALVTQNIDRLHQRSGVPAERLIEIHGNSSEGRCVDCRSIMGLGTVREIIERTSASPRCSCGGLVKAAIISFGEQIPQTTLLRAAEVAEDADLFIVIGSSLQVQPAAALPLIAKRAGARLAIVNRDATPIDRFAEIKVHQPIGLVFSSLYPQLVSETFSSQ
jgi:NAD-dependent deacetylase